MTRFKKSSAPSFSYAFFAIVLDLVDTATSEFFADVFKLIELIEGVETGAFTTFVTTGCWAPLLDFNTIYFVVTEEGKPLVVLAAEFDCIRSLSSGYHIKTLKRRQKIGVLQFNDIQFNTVHFKT